MPIRTYLGRNSHTQEKVDYEILGQINGLLRVQMIKNDLLSKYIKILSILAPLLSSISAGGYQLYEWAIIDSRSWRSA